VARAVIDLFSDTSTKPSVEMRRYMCAAEVGDEQRGEDPTVNRLQDIVADLLGKEAALYLPSGTMCNQIAFAIHCRAGDEIIMDQTAHPLNHEGGGPSALTGAVIRPLNGAHGIFTVEELRAAIRHPNRYEPTSRTVSVEQTTNLGGGACWPLETIRAVCDEAHASGLAAHLDGARLFNAVVATGIASGDFAALFDSAWIDLSKGLGAPVGAVLAGSSAFIDEAWRFKQRFGGAMRQAGIIAAAGIYARQHNVDRLADDHANAKLLAEGLADIPGIAIDPAVQTNIVLFEVTAPGMTAERFITVMLEEHGIYFSQMSETLIRAVTHLDVSQDAIHTALRATREVLAVNLRRSEDGIRP
jgi:threonine aldolase